MKNSVSYEDFLGNRSRSGDWHGFDAKPSPFLFDFQESLVAWALKRGRSAIFADCGLGKTPMQLAWSDAVVRHTNKPVLVEREVEQAPLFVAAGRDDGDDVMGSAMGRSWRKP